MAKTLIIVRHGNTFHPGEIPTRVGRKTDLPLVEEGRARAIGKYLAEHGLVPGKIYTSPLKRTMGTASLIISEMSLSLKPIPEEDFTEIDYGPDENKTEDEVIARLGLRHLEKNNLPAGASCEEITAYGKEAIGLWNNEAIVPDGWVVDVPQIIGAWKNFAANIKENETTLLCTSNGIIRFAPCILDTPYTEFCRRHDIKVATGSVSVFRCENNRWTCTHWNIKPYKIYGEAK